MAKKVKDSVSSTYVKVCPKCKSTNVSFGTSTNMWGIPYLPAGNVCKDCGYTSKTFPELQISKLNKYKKLKIGKEQKNKVDMSYGKFMVRRWWKVAGPLALILAFMLLYIALNPQKCNYQTRLTQLSPPGAWLCQKNTDILFNKPVLTLAVIVLAVGIAAIYFAYLKKYPEG